MKKSVFILLLSILSLVAFLLILLSTSRLGVNLDDDSVFYIRLAHGFLDHTANPETMKILLLRFGPFFPLCLSWVGHLGIDLFQGARWLNALLFAFNIFLAGSVLMKYTGSGWLSLCGSFLILAASDMVEIHSQAMSEPLFFIFLLLWLLFFWEYFKEPKLLILLAASICTALSFVTRYAGITLVAAGLLGVFVLSRQMINKKIRHAVIFFFISCVPLGLFLAWDKYVFGNASARDFIFHPLTSHNWQEIASVFCSWFISHGVYAQESLFLLLIGIIGLFFAGFILWDRARKASRETHGTSVFLKFSLLLIAFIFFYIISIIFSATFMDAKFISSFRRYFLPVHIAGLFLFLGFMRRVFFPKQTPSLRGETGKIVLGYLLLFYSVNSAPYLIKQYTLGDRYARGPLRDSLIIRAVKEIPFKIPVYTNDSSSVYVLAGRESFEIPSSRDALNQKKNDAYASQFARMENDLKYKRGVLVYFKEDYTESGAEPVQEVSKKISLHLVTRDPYGAIYAF